MRRRRVSSGLTMDRQRLERRRGSAQLAVLAAAPVYADLHDAAVAARLASDAGSRAGQGLAPRLRYGVATFDAVLSPGPRRQPGARRQHTVRDGVLDLIQHSAIMRP